MENTPIVIDGKQYDVCFKVVLDDGAIMPHRANNDDDNVGYDICVNDIKVGEDYPVLQYNAEGVLQVHMVPRVIIVDTGVHVQPRNKSFYVEAAPNSRVGKRPFDLGNSIGFIDVNYTGSIKFIYKVSPWVTDEDINSFFQRGQVCGQLIIRKKYNGYFELVDSLNKTNRGENGFGSTQKSLA